VDVAVEVEVLELPEERLDTDFIPVPELDEVLVDVGELELLVIEEELVLEDSLLEVLDVPLMLEDVVVTVEAEKVELEVVVLVVELEVWTVVDEVVDVLEDVVEAPAVQATPPFVSHQFPPQLPVQRLLSSWHQSDSIRALEYSHQFWL